MASNLKITKTDFKSTKKSHEILKPDEVDLVIYHRKCIDGFACILVIHLLNQYNASEKPKNLQYIPVNHNNYTIPDVKGKNVLICDFSFNYEETLEIIREAKNVLIIDHHDTSANKLKDIEPQYKIFDTNHSAAVLTWKYVFPNIPIPLLLQYIQDRDTSRNSMEFTNEFFVWFSTIPQVFDMYEKYLDNNVLTKMIKNYGVIYYKLNSYYVNGSAEHAKASFTMIQIENKITYYFIGYHNQTNFKSDVGNAIMSKYKNLDFSAVYSISDNTYKSKFALRSTNNSVDVSKIAELFGGGGHRNAAGLVFPYVITKLERDDTKITFDKKNKLKFGTSNNEMGGKQVIVKTLSTNQNLYSNLINIQIIVVQKYNVAYLNTFACYKELANYLMQMKEGDSGLQQAVYIYNNTHNTEHDYKINFALTYYYDSNKDIRSYYACDLDKKTANELRNEVLEIIKKLKN